MKPSFGLATSRKTYDRGALHDELVQEVIIALSATNLCRVWSQPTGAAYRDNTLVRYGTKGSADISGILIGGKRIEIEIKTGQATQQKNQKEFQAMIEMMGGLYKVARSVEDAVSWIKAEAAKVHS